MKDPDDDPGAKIIGPIIGSVIGPVTGPAIISASNFSTLELLFQHSHTHTLCLNYFA